MRFKDMIMITQDEFFDILTSSPHSFYNKLTGTRKEDLYFDLGD